jgi:hypothetical protein
MDVQCILLYTQTTPSIPPKAVYYYEKKVVWIDPTVSNISYHSVSVLCTNK